jgi:hypothetical protein
MPDAARRSALSSRARTLRTKADEFMARCNDTEAKQLVKQMVLHHADDVEGFFLGEPNSRPSQTNHEKMWLDNAEMVLSMGEHGLASLEKQFAVYGGPENVQVIGMK